MSKLTRRRLLGSIAAVGVSGSALNALTSAPLEPGSKAHDSPALPSNVDDVWKHLVKKRRRIKSFHAILEMEITRQAAERDENPTAAWTREGTTEIFYDSGRYRLVHERPAGRITEVLSRSHYIQWIEDESGAQPSRVIMEGPPDRRRSPKMTIESIVPAPENKPVSYLGLETAEGVPHHVLLQGERRFYLRVDTGAVSRVDVFFTSDWVGMSVRFSDYRGFESGIDVPRVVRARELTEDGDLIREQTTRLTDIQVNPKLDPKLFIARRP